MSCVVVATSALAIAFKRHTGMLVLRACDDSNRMYACDVHLSYRRPVARTQGDALHEATLTCGAVGIDHTAAISAVQASLAHPAVVAALSSAATLLATAGAKVGVQAIAVSAAGQHSASSAVEPAPKASSAVDDERTSLAAPEQRITEAEIWRVALSGLSTSTVPSVTKEARAGRQAPAWCVLRRAYRLYLARAGCQCRKAA